LQHVSGAGDGHALQTTATKKILPVGLSSSERFCTVFSAGVNVRVLEIFSLEKNDKNYAILV
jgi:hypothetical protein